MDCAHCHRAFPEGSVAIARIAIGVMGDEYIYSYWACAECGAYTVRSYFDPFMGDEGEVKIVGALTHEAGERVVQLVAACPDPMDKNCECASHAALYYGRP